MSEKNEIARLEAFCDGVFAIAMTLLVIEIKVPAIEAVHSNKELWMAFAHSWPSWMAFLISFITILISWVNHSHGSKLIAKSSPKFLYANGLLLLSVIILPFPTVAVAEYINTEMAQPPITLYCGVALLNNIAWNLIGFVSVYPKSLYKSNVNMEKVKETTKYTMMGFGLYAFAFLLSFWFPLVAFTLISTSFAAWLILGISLKEEKMLN